MTPRVALILPSSTYRARDFMDAARAVDAEIVIATESDQAMADPSRVLVIDLEQPEHAAQQIVAAGPFDAVIPVDDGGVLIGAMAAERLGLSHSPPDAVAATRDKAVMRLLFAEAAVPQPAFEIVDGDGVDRACAKVGYPCVIKPTRLAASQGVIRVDSAHDVVTTAERVRVIAARAGAGSTLLIEEYMAGDEVAVEGMLQDGAFVPLAVLDKPEPLDGPYFEETIFVTPSRHEPAVLGELVDVVAQAAAALGLVEGPVHAEARITTDGVKMLELAARPIGGLCSRALEFGIFGASLETVLLRNALRLPQAGVERAVPATGVMMIPIPRSGRLQHIDGLAEARGVPAVTDVTITIPLGEHVEALPEGRRYLGFIFAKAHHVDDVVDALVESHEHLTITIA